MATLYDIDMEAGNLSEWSATTTDGGDLSAAAGAALAGTSYGITATVDGSSNRTTITLDGS